ncbi:MAG: ribonuclease Y [Candidatus Dojkabacteria bacterium]|nr:ribonuclease Y [Candidatus Dojkabacteria bacterium]
MNNFILVTLFLIILLPTFFILFTLVIQNRKYKQEITILKNDLKKTKRIEEENQENTKKLQEQLKIKERTLLEKEKNLTNRSRLLDERSSYLDKKEISLTHQQNEIIQIKEKYSKKIEEVSKLSKQEAEKLLKEEIEASLSNWMGKKIREFEQELRIKSDEIAKEILIDSMIKAHNDYVIDFTTSTIEIPNDQIKSKIIGKNGRNLKIFEKETKVELIIDDTPNIVTISCFDPVRRETAVVALKKLIHDNRINPSTIEEAVKRAKKEIEAEVRKAGEELAYETGFNNLPNDIINMLGKFKYRYSYGQNLIKHTLEVVKIGEYIATELKADVRTTKLACLLHDIGKVSADDSRQHHHISADIAKKFFPNNPKLINAIAAHHYDIEAKYIEAEIVRIADSISSARPGARKDSYEESVKRITELEQIALKYKGVKEAYALRAGKEIRVILEPTQTTDEDVSVIAYKIEKEIEESQQYPWPVKVDVIREVRANVETKLKRNI